MIEHAGDSELLHPLDRDAGSSVRDELRRAREELRELNKIGMALMSERDPDRLLGTILTQARRLTTSDAGSLYLVDGDAESPNLRFLRAQNDSIPDLPDPDFTLPLDRTSIAGYAASTGEPLVLDDAYELPPGAPYTFNHAFDHEHGYRAKSMLAVPMRDHRDRVVGVLQLINRKETPSAVIRDEADASRHVLPYGHREVEIVQSLAGQAAVSIENGQLYRNIEALFEGFIRAAVTAIDQRDPTTSGHSLRVTELTCRLAEAVNRQRDGRFRDVRFSREEMKQLRYAGLLHDVGKVGVREEILVKARKLPPIRWERLEGRFERVRTLLRLEFERERADRLEAEGTGPAYDAWLARRQAAFEAEVERLDRFFEALKRANEPRSLTAEDEQALEEIRGVSVPDLSGGEVPLLEDDEMEYLRIRRGSLSDDEIRQIQSHVMLSYDFLQNIPWTEELRRIDEIVRSHHEKMNGAGYPDGIEGEQINLESRMMAIADIFDALTAADRPYKKSIPVGEALEILREEADEGRLDPDLVDLFIECGVYAPVVEMDWRELM